VTYAGFPKDQIGFDTQGNFGGELNLLDGEVKIAFIPAVHSSAVANEDGKNLHDGGNPGGFLIRVKNGPTIYHTGDTDVFADMALIAKFGKVDLMLACIGGHFTMGPERAAHAVNLVKPSSVVPIHFGTFPVLSGTPEAFGAALRKQGVRSKLQVMTIGQTLKL
jgi:L-ascorbate metabolism protein UlaG (beta-lactamase superfamily)